MTTPFHTIENRLGKVIIDNDCFMRINEILEELDKGKYAMQDQDDIVCVFGDAIQELGYIALDDFGIAAAVCANAKNYLITDIGQFLEDCEREGVSMYYEQETETFLPSVGPYDLIIFISAGKF